MIWWLKLPSSITKTYPIYLSRPFSHTCPDQIMAAICSPVLAGTALLLFEFPLGELDEFTRIYVWQNGQVWKNKNNKRNLLLDATVAALHWQHYPDRCITFSGHFDLNLMKTAGWQLETQFQSVVVESLLHRSGSFLQLWGPWWNCKRRTGLPGRDLKIAAELKTICRCAQKNLFDLPGPIPFHRNKVLIIKGTKAIQILKAHSDKFACKTDIKS